jgi:hypothetical protein
MNWITVLAPFINRKQITIPKRIRRYDFKKVIEKVPVCKNGLDDNFDKTFE